MRESMVRRTSSPGCGSRLHLRRESAPLYILGNQHFAGVPGQLVVQALLDSAVAVLFEIDAADDVRGQRAVRIIPLALGAELDPFQIQSRAAAWPPRE